MNFPLGRPILLMIAVALLGGVALLTRPAAGRADLVVWVFYEPHARAYRSVAGEFTRRTGLTVDVQLVASRALAVRLESLFMSGLPSDAAPDLVELELSHVGKFFRPPPDEIGFVPLDALLERSGEGDKIIPSRFAPWSKGGVIFGVPLDVHPVTLSFRDDLFREVGIDPASARTWPEFHALCLEFQRRWRERDPNRPTPRRALELKSASADYLVAMLLQRGINLVEDDGRVNLEAPEVAETVAFYATLVAGEHRIAAEGSDASSTWANDLVAGDVCALFTPDWRVSDLKARAPALAGKMRMMPLPVFEIGDAPTSTWGGTMMGLPKAGRRHQEAWELMRFLCFGRAAIDARRRFTDTLPAVKTLWDDPAYHRPDPFFTDAAGRPQRVNELYVELAERIPARNVTPDTAMAQAELSFVLVRATQYVRARGAAGLGAACRAWLAAAAEDLRRRVRHGRIE